MEIGINDIVKIERDPDNQYQIIQTHFTNLSSYNVWGELNDSIGYLIKNIKTQELSFISKRDIKTHIICDRVKKEPNKKIENKIEDSKKMEIGVILPSCQIPDGSTVTKQNGIQRYSLNRKMNIYGSFNQVIERNNIDFLITNGSSHITAISNNLELVWITTEEKYYKYLQNKYENNEEK